MLSEVGTDMHTQKKAAESWFTIKPHHKSLLLFLLAENMSVKAGHRRPEQYWQTRAGGETEVRLWSQQKSGCVFGEYSMALGQCLSDSVSMRSAVTSENCTFEHMPWGKQCSWITLPQFHQEQTKPISAMSLWGMFHDLDCIWVIRDFKGPLSKSIKALQNMTGTGIQ